jgi:hypothetical protein
MNDWITDISNTNAAQLHALAQRLVKLELLDLEDDPDEEIEFGFINDLVTGELVPAICPDGVSTYWEHGRELIGQKEAAGRTKYRQIGSDGPGPWKDVPPPSQRWKAN